MGETETTATWSEFLADPDAHAARLPEIGYEVLTVDGRRTYALMPIEELDRMRQEQELGEVRASIVQAMKQIDVGGGVPLAEVRTQLRAKHGF